MKTIRSKIIDSATGSVVGFFVSEGDSGLAEAEYCAAHGMHVGERRAVFCYDGNRSGFIPLAEMRDAFSMAEVARGILVREVGKLPDQEEWKAIDAAQDDVKRWAAAYADRQPAYKDQARAAWEIGYNRTCRLG
jgi:hypothetical protein